MHPKGEHHPNLELNLQDVCDGMTIQQLKVRNRQQDHLVRSARERVLSARSSISPSLSMRDISRLSTRTRQEVDDTEEVKSCAGDFDDIPNNGTYSRSEYSTPDLNSDCGSSYSQIARAKTLPDADMLKPEFRIDERPELRSYNSFSGDLPRKRLCMRSKSAVSREFDGIVNGLSRQCCDVLGPKVCHQCALYKRRLMDSHKHESPLSRLHTSERNFADSIILSRTLPDLSLEEIEDKVISGEISRISLRERLFVKRERTMQEKSAKARHREFVKEKGKTWNGVSSTFFMNIKDLNQRVLVGKLTNNLKEINDPSKSRWNPIKNAVKQTQDLTLTEKLLPSFRSNRRNSEQKVKAKLVDKYEPPLLPKVCQNVAPSFFAGSSTTYELPDRLPEKVVDDQIDDFGVFDAAWSRSSSRNQSSKETINPEDVPSKETGAEENQAGDVKVDNINIKQDNGDSIVEKEVEVSLKAFVNGDKSSSNTEGAKSEEAVLATEKEVLPSKTDEHLDS